MKRIIAAAVLGFAVMTAQAQVPTQFLGNVSISNSQGQLEFTLLASTVKGLVAKNGAVIASMQLVGHGGGQPTRFVAYVSGCEGTDGALALWSGPGRGEPILWSSKGIQVGDAIAVAICGALAITRPHERLVQARKPL